MKIRCTNLGTIRKTELDLRPLTVIVGPNNSSKTYLAYSIYGLWRELRSVDPLLSTLLHAQLAASGRSTRWRIERLTEALGTHVESATRRFEAGLGTFFQDSSDKLFRRTKFHIDWEPDPQRLQASLERASTPTDAALAAPDEPGLADTIVHDALALTTPFILPAERNALIITYKVLSNRRFKLLRDAARVRKPGRRRADEPREQGEPGDVRYPLPVEDFLDFLADVELVATRRPRAGKSEFVKLAALLEANIQSGNRLELAPTPIGGRELRVGVGDDLSIDLYNASSSIKQLSALVLYLRYRAAPNQLLIIDEPEMNLHPASQVRLLEILAILVRLGVRVLVTTHSPYLMAHLANLAQRAEDPRIRKKQAAQLYLADPRALLSDAEVGAYEMRDHRLVSLKDPEFGLRWDTLSDVFSDLQQRFFALDGLAHGKPGK